jgi:hypothetical protein
MAVKKSKVVKTAEKGTAKIAGILAWIVGVLVSLSVGAGMVNAVLTLETLYIPVIVTVVAGWIVIVGTILSVIMALFGK